MENYFHSMNITGITSKVKITELSMPPIVGSAMRCITSEPVPSPNIIGIRPTIMAA